MALEAWERKLLSIITKKESNVVPMIRNAVEACGIVHHFVGYSGHMSSRFSRGGCGISADILALEEETESLLGEITGGGRR